MNNSSIKYGILIGINFVYACTAVFTKMASRYGFLSWNYIVWVLGAVLVMGIYALLWQQVIKRLPLSTAYMFKGTSLVFVLLLSVLLFGEHVSFSNILGSIIIISGIAIFAKA